MNQIKNKKNQFGGKYKQAYQRDGSVEYKGETAKNAIMFLSTEAFDYNQAMENGTIAKKTKIVCPEKELPIAKLIEKNYAKYNSNLKVEHGFFHEIDYSKFFKKGTLDYINFDICGNMTLQIFNKFHEISPLLAPAVRLPITLCVPMRKGQAVKNTVKKYLSKQFGYKITDKRIRLWLDKYIDNNLIENNNWKNIAKSDKLITAMAYQVAMVCCLTKTHNINIKSISCWKNIDKNNMAVWMMSIKCEAIICKLTGKKKFNIPFIDIVSVNKTKKTNTVNKTSFRKLLQITTRKHFNYLYKNSAKFNSQLEKMAKKNETSVGRIIGGIKRELTCGER